MDYLVEVLTDTASIAIFDPVVLWQRVWHDPQWWCREFNEIEEVRIGDFSMISLGADGAYRVRLTDGQLTSDERAYATASIGPLGLRVESGQVMICAAECLPGGGRETSIEGGAMLNVPAGQYEMQFYLIHWIDCPGWWNAESADRTNAPPEIVVQICRVTEPFAVITYEPRLDGFGESWVFPNEARELGPKVGMELISIVRRAPEGLVLKECGPGNYSVTLEDYSQVKWRDRICFVVTSVDRQSRRLVGRFIKKV